MIGIPLSIEKCILACWFDATSVPLNSCIPTNSNLYFDISSSTVLSDAALYNIIIIIIIIISGVRLSLLVLRPLVAYCTSPR
jgi:hypothetical protein